MDEVKAAFKKFKGAFFLLEPSQQLLWSKNDSTGLPDNVIYGGPQGRPPIRRFSPYEIKRAECTKPGLFKKGMFTLYGMDDNVLIEFPHKDKENCKMAETFNYYLDLYRSYNLPK